VAYAVDGTQGAAIYLNEFGLTAKLISVDNTQAYLGTDDGAIVVAFRGSEQPTTVDGLKDWLLTNANNYLVLPEGRMGTDFVAAGVGARFHRGFLGALEEVWDPLFAAVSAALDEKERPVWVTGHSLGGALALLAAWRFKRQFIPVHQIYTFGAPMIGNQAAADAFAREFPDKIFRYIDDRDLVPRLPMMSLVGNAYIHCAGEVALSLISDQDESAASALQRIGGDSAEPALSVPLMDGIWKALMDRIDSHLLPNYLARIVARKGTTA
jgi:predicted lipase